MQNSPEVLAPCGSPQCVEAAVNCGCDAVYLGAQEFSARQGCANFTPQQLKDTVEYCHKNGVKVYQAINTLVFDSQMKNVADMLKQACNIGIDGIIVQDLGIIALAKELCPDMPLHASTQMTVHTVDGVKMCERMGLCRVVAARELPIENIKKLCGTGMPIEVFVHGALCMSVSGQCYMSAMIGSRSANRGMCAQACRLPFSAAAGADRHDLSLKDMSYFGDLEKLREAGVASLKIEGRMKRPEYVAAAVHSCRQALDGREYDEEMLKNVFSRGGFTDGYLFSKTGKEMFGMRSAEDAQQTKEALPAIHELYRRPYKRFTADMKIKAAVGEKLELTAKSGDIFATVTGEILQAADSRPTSSDEIKKCLTKLGATAYEVGKTECESDSAAFVSAAAANKLRREALEELDEKRLKKSTAAYNCGEYVPQKDIKREKRRQAVRVHLNTLQQLDSEIYDLAQLVILPLSQLEKLDKIKDKMCAALPRFDFFEGQTKERIERLKGLGLKHVLATNLAHFDWREGLAIHGGFGLNVTNSRAAKMLQTLGASDLTVSPELTHGQIERLQTPLPLGCIAYGKLPLMLTANCPNRAFSGCKNCTKHITDRTGRRFEIACRKEHGYVEILNSDTLWLADKLVDFETLDHLDLLFFEETFARIKQVIKAYIAGEAFTLDKNITRGLYYRGIQ